MKMAKMAQLWNGRSRQLYPYIHTSIHRLQLIYVLLNIIISLLSLFFRKYISRSINYLS